jgi:rhodanese-related sulfurtransferase
MNRTIKPEELTEQLAINANITLLDVRRNSDYDSAKDSLPHAEWRDPYKVAEWGSVLPKDGSVVIYCVRGGSVSNRVLDELLKKDVPARFIEGGIEAWKADGNNTDIKSSV